MLQFCRNRLKLKLAMAKAVTDVGTNPLLLVVKL